MASERVIKKYANRRLYDAAESRHVTLEDLRKLIVQGEKIKVVDDKSGEDLTRSILLQIIADQEQFGQPILSTPTLESIIRFYGDAMQGFMGRYLEQSVASFVSQQQALQSQLTKMVSGTPLATMADLAQANFAMWQQMQENLVSVLKPRTAAPPPSSGPSSSGPSPSGQPGQGSASHGHSTPGHASHAPASHSRSASHDAGREPADDDAPPAHSTRRPRRGKNPRA
jgi:polyhydroxyalkanoate synthesis repressor PhaR